jgi:hypothetical protein
MCLPTCDGGGPDLARQDGTHRTVTDFECALPQRAHRPKSDPGNTSKAWRGLLGGGSSGGFSEGFN